MDKGVLKSVPGGFYDLIVYFASSVVLVGSAALLLCDAATITELLSKLTVSGFSLLFLFLICFSYLYGQLASTLSALFIKKPVNSIVSRFHPKQMRDYFFDYPEACRDFPVLALVGKGQSKNYWTILYFIKISYPDIADDLLKRYARCKLARVNAFNFLVLCSFTLSLCILRKLGVTGIPEVANLRPTVWVVSFALVFGAYTLDFYQRQCWFGDILIKILAAVSKHLAVGGAVNQHKT